MFALSLLSFLAHSPTPLFDATDELLTPVLVEADGAPISTSEHIGHAGPVMADVLGDARPELLVGNFRGHLQVFENTASSGIPVWTARGLLKAGEEPLEVPNW